MSHYENAVRDRKMQQMLRHKTAIQYRTKPNPIASALRLALSRGLIGLGNRIQAWPQATTSHQETSPY
jgi:hypothetical protein